MDAGSPGGTCASQVGRPGKVVTARVPAWAPNPLPGIWGSLPCGRDTFRFRPSPFRRAHVWVTSGLRVPVGSPSDISPLTLTINPSSGRRTHTLVNLRPQRPQAGHLLASHPTICPSPGRRASTWGISRPSSPQSTCHSAAQPPRCTDPPLWDQILQPSGQWRPGPQLWGHCLRAELRPRPLRHRGDPDQRPRQQPGPPEPHGAPGPAPGSQRLSAGALRSPLRGALGPRAGALVPRSPKFHR